MTQPELEVLRHEMAICTDDCRLYLDRAILELETVATAIRNDRDDDTLTATVRVQASLLEAGAILRLIAQKIETRHRVRARLTTNTLHPS